MNLTRAAAMGCLALALAGLAGCNPEEQKKLDMQACSGYGFQPGSNEFAACMMQTAQNRQAQQSADQRQQSYNKMIADQAQKDRDNQAQAARDAESNRMIGDTSINGAASIASPPVTTIPSMDMSNMHCTGSSIANAGSMSCSSN
jgi:hypothetical protein